jgi:hypothetical protein
MFSPQTLRAAIATAFQLPQQIPTLFAEANDGEITFNFFVTIFFIFL